MKLRIEFKQSNSEYNQEYANQYNFGKESENNQKYHWAHAFELVDEIDKISITKNQSIQVTDSKDKLDILKIHLEKITIFKCFNGDNLYVQYAVSDKLLERIHEVYKEKTDTKYCYFYLKDIDDYVELKEHHYILKKDITILN